MGEVESRHCTCFIAHERAAMSLRALRAVSPIPLNRHAHCQRKGCAEDPKDFPLCLAPLRRPSDQTRPTTFPSPLASPPLRLRSHHQGHLRRTSPAFPLPIHTPGHFAAVSHSAFASSLTTIGRPSNSPLLNCEMAVCAASAVANRTVPNLAIADALGAQLTVGR